MANVTEQNEYHMVAKALLTVGQVIFYLTIVFLCILGGAIANPDLHVADFTDISYQALNFLRGGGPQEANRSLVAALFFFLCYFFARWIFVDAPPTVTEGGTNVSMVLLPFFYLMLLAFSWILWSHGALRNFFLLVCVTLPPTIMFFSSCYALKFSKDSAHDFLPKIFYPAFATCFLSFCLGWALANPRGNAQLFQLDKIELIFCCFSIFIVIFFFVSFWRNTVGAIAWVFTLMVIGTLSASAAFYSQIGLSLPIALLWTFALGVAEVAKRPHLVSTGQVAVGSRETIDFYIAGANWSSILFFNLLLLMPLLVLSTSMLFVVVVAWGSIIAWHAIKNKNSLFAYYVGLCIGCLLPTTIIALLLLGKIPYPAELKPPPITNATDRLITLLGIFLTIIFVLYHDVYRKMPEEVRASPAWFKSKRNCMLFAALVVAIEAVLLTTGVSVVNAWRGAAEAMPEIQFRIDFILICLLAELVAILILLFIVDDDEAADGSDAVLEFVVIDGGGTFRPGQAVRADQVSERSVVLKPSRIQVAFRLARPFNSAIAGLLSFVSGIRLSDMDVQSATLVFVATSTLCMFGYVVNDIFDREKDTLAGRMDKPLASMSIPMNKAVGFAAALALVSLSFGSLVGSDVYWTVFVSLILVLGYSDFSRAVPKLKGFYTAGLCCLPLVIGARGDMSVLHLSSLLVVVLFIFGREMIIDVLDSKNDELSKHFTLALVIGAPRALAIGWITMLASAPLMFSIEMNELGKSLAALAVASLIGIFLIYRFRDAERVVSLSRIPMLLTIGSFLFQS